MLRFLIVLLVFVVSIYALSDLGTLKRADGLLKTGSKSNYFRAYNDYKNIYLRSVMNGDKRLRLKALNGIIKSGTKLHIDVSRYKKEYSSLSHKKINKSKKSYISNNTRLRYSKVVNDKLILTFDKKLTKKQINYFKLYNSKKRRYRYIFDIHAVLSKNKTLRKKGINRIRIAQYNSKTIRVVIEDSRAVNIRFKRNFKQLIISINANKTKYFKKPTKIFKSKIPKRADRDKIIVIDPGHGGKDPGAIGYKKYREKVVVFKIAKYLRNILRSRGYKVYMTRYSDKFIELKNRTGYANKKKADLFISIHANAVPRRNASKVHGIETYFLSPSRSKRAEKVAAKENSADIGYMNAYGKKSFLNVLNHVKIIASNKLAIDLQRGILGALNKKYKGVKDGGVREGPFWVLVGAQMPAVLIEVGFISHPKEAKRLVNDKYRKIMATGIADGIERYFANN